MTSTYFTLPSFARAKKNKEDLEKTNPQEPVLNDEDASFLQRHMSTDEAQASSKDTGLPTKISDDGEVTEAKPEEIVHGGDEAVVPETQPPNVGSGGEDGAVESKEDETATDAKEEDAQGDDAATQAEEKDADTATEQPASYDDTMKEKAAERVQARKAKKSKGMDLPTQEEAEAATKGFNEKAAQEAANQEQGQKKTWASYLPSMRPSSRKADGSGEQTAEGEKEKTDDATTESGDATSTDQASQRTWTQYATSYVPSIPALPTSWTSKSKDADSQAHPVYNEDGTINEAATAEQQEKEVSVLLDNLNMSSINNRVFAFSAETQKIYERFALVLKDCINGAPTAYEDMDKLMKEAGPKLEAQFKSMPPFVQTLVKSLPMRLGSTLGPELMAAASEKPGNDLNAKLAAASKPGASGASSAAGINVPEKKAEGGEGKEADGKKKKRTIPGMKGLIHEKSTVATMLRSVVNFLQTRFPFLASTTNVVMSLAVFILMFVFWYCHKRGREVRLAKEGAAAEGIEGPEEDEDGVVEVSDSGEEGEAEDEMEEGRGEKEMDEAVKEADEKMQEITKAIDEKTEALSKPEPSEVPLPEKTGEKE